MEPAIYDLRIICGTTLDDSVVRFGPWKIDDVVTDLTGVEVVARAVTSSGVAIFEYSSVSGGVQLDAALGEFWLEASTEETSAYWVVDAPRMPPSKGIDYWYAGDWEVSLNWPSGRVETLIRGKLALAPTRKPRVAA